MDGMEAGGPGVWSTSGFVPSASTSHWCSAPRKELPPRLSWEGQAGKHPRLGKVTLLIPGNSFVYPSSRKQKHPGSGLQAWEDILAKIYLSYIKRGLKPEMRRGKQLKERW